MNEEINLYVVVNSDGHYFRRKGYQGRGKSWTEDFEVARVWNRISQARATVTFFANKYPNYPTPKILKLIVNKTEILDEKERVTTVINKKKELKLKRDMNSKKYLMEKAKREMEEAQKLYEKLKGERYE